MGGLGIVGIVILVVNGLFSYQGFNDINFKRKYVFNVQAILGYKDYKRLLTSGFLHADWSHLGFNMITFYFFGRSLEAYLGSFPFAVIYLVSLVVGNLMALWIHKDNSHYTALGASGAVGGVLFAFIAFFPDQSLYLMFIPIPIPAWVVGVGYVLYSIYGIKSQRDNIGHEAHLGGAIAGLLTALLFVPEMAKSNAFVIFLILVPSVVFLVVMLFKPHLIKQGSPFKSKHVLYDVDDRFNNKKVESQKEIDRILEKINDSGLESLTKEEKKKLDEHSE